MIKRVFKLFQIARKLSTSGAIDTINRLHQIPVSINLFFRFRSDKDFLSKEEFNFFVVRVTLLITIFLEFTKQILVSVFPISPTIMLL